ncbi:MAG TPA: HDOD domain-containing protein [Candidatus Bathyarchaeia archaeon]|nr:HDOD domain-containing protein [Candidatus Bathyarchaeia archaeon]
METDRYAAVEAVIACVGELPALPSVVAEVLQITGDPAAAVSQISEHVQRDPGLAAKILKVSNSPYYGMKQHVGSLKLALVILGVREVRNIVLGISVLEQLQDQGFQNSVVMRDFWTHSVTVAALTKRLGAAFALGLQGEDFTSGLLHDIGKMVLFRQLGSTYQQIFIAADGVATRLCELETESFGFDHADAAAALAIHWNLPPSLVDSLWCHHPAPHRPLNDANNPRLAASVCIANLAAHDNFDLPPDQCASCTIEAAWSILASAKTPADIHQRKQLLAGFREQLSQSPLLQF